MRLQDRIIDLPMVSQASQLARLAYADACASGMWEKPKRQRRRRLSRGSSACLNAMYVALV